MEIPLQAHPSSHGFRYCWGLAAVIAAVLVTVGLIIALALMR
jgi:hypothetical protein